MRKLALALITLCLPILPAQADVARDGLACAAGLSRCEGLAVTAEEALLVLGFVTQEDARFHYDALYGHGGQGRPIADLGRYQQVARFYDQVRNRTTCGGNSRAIESSGGESVLSLGADGVLMLDRLPLFHYDLTLSEALLTLGLCGPLARLNGQTALDWVGAVDHIRSRDAPEDLGVQSGFIVIGQDRLVILDAAHQAFFAIGSGQDESWFVTFWQRIAAEDGSPVTPRSPVVTSGGGGPGGGNGGGSGSTSAAPPILPPLPVPFAEIEAANRDPASACTTLQQVIAALRGMGAVEMLEWAEAQLATLPEGADRCADILALLREADERARDTDPPATTPTQGFLGFAPAPANP